MAMRISVEAYGCTLNQGESRIMEELLENKGHEIVSPKEAEASLIMTCCVIDSTERRMLKRIGDLEARKKPVLVGGCMASIMKEKVRNIAPDAVFVSPGDVNKVLREVAGTAEIEREGIDENAISRDSIDAIVPIGQGCTEQCSYCITRLARGSLKSYSEDNIENMVSRRLKEGYKEIRLTSQDTAAYGQDIGSSLPNVLNKVTSLQGDFKVRVGMANITNLLPILRETLDSYESEKIYKFLHVPVQSGDDRMLSKMNRRYAVDDFISVVSTFRSQYPDSTISTDIITGFPGETEEQFRASLRLMEETQPEIINVTRFSPREGTAAFEMDEKVPGWKSKERSRELTKLRSEISLKKNSSLIGSVLNVMTTEHVKSGTTMGRTSSYRPIVLPEALPLGIFCDAKVVSARDAYLIGELA
ncbi:MAG: tRNA (N(6)-L-threonylcarbamoyladenosine(37)-C(2))-methylthiotransferase [Methanobacteriota archaeon]|nr:MAG: tRNA (N(6)-L-threonylcarbamoyladenosine(37)-C(2))-methylthiotransferase [Euryarchaeota archaeon]